MDRTVPSYRLASERERRKWKIFRQELDSEYCLDHVDKILTGGNPV